MSTSNIKEERRMRFCILGGGGFLGRTLAHELQENGNFVVLLDLTFPEAEFAHIPLRNEASSKIKGSILNRELLREALADCDACFHLAGYGMSGGASLNRDRCFEVNVNGTANVIEECRRMGVPRLIFTSSVSVIFDGENELHMADEENTPYAKIFGNPYVESKCEAEKMLLAANDPPNLFTCALRLRGIYGPGELRTVQRCVNLCMFGIIKCAFTKSPYEKTLTQYSSAENIVQALMLAEKSLQNEQSPAAGNKYHIVDGGEPVHSWEFWFPLISALGCSPPRVRIPYSLAQTLAFIFELLYQWFGIEPLFTRYEAALTAVANTYSIRRAQQDLGYCPVNCHQLGPTIELCQQQLQSRQMEKERQIKEDAVDYSKWIWVAIALFEGFSVEKGGLLLSVSKWCAFGVLLLFLAGGISQLCYWL